MSVVSLAYEMRVKERDDARRERDQARGVLGLWDRWVKEDDRVAYSIGGEYDQDTLAQAIDETRAILGVGKPPEPTRAEMQADYANIKAELESARVAVKALGECLECAEESNRNLKAELEDAKIEVREMAEAIRILGSMRGKSASQRLAEFQARQEEIGRQAAMAANEYVGEEGSGASEWVAD